MSDDIIKVHDLPAIARYSKSVQEFAKGVDSASKETERTFNVKTGKTEGEGDEGEAINAFFERLNQLQTQVFKEFPTTITHFSTALSKFEGEVTGAGFEKKAWTQQSGNDTVYNKLNGAESEQYQKVEEKAKALQTLLDDASGKLGIESEDLTPIKTSAMSKLTDAANNRRNTHNALQGAHDDLSKKATEVESELQDLQTKIVNARAISSIPAANIFEGIQNGSFRKSKLEYFDGIQTEADGRALGALLAKRPEEILNEKPENLSEGLYVISAREMMAWIKSGDKDTLNRLLKAMGEREFSENEPFLKSFQQAGIKLGDTTMEAMELERQTNGDLNSKQMSEYSGYLDLSDKFVGLMETLYMLGIGTVRTTSGSLNNNSRLYTTDTTTKLTIDDLNASSSTVGLNAKIITRKMTTESNAYGMIYPVGDYTTTEEKQYKTQIFSTYEGVDSWENHARLGELAEARKQARKDLAASLAKTAGYGAVTVFAPEILPLVMAIDGLASSDTTKFTKQLSSFVDKNVTIGNKTIQGGFSKTGSYVFGLTAPIEALENYVSYVNTLNDAQKEAEEVRLKFINRFLDKGGAYLGQDLGKGEVVNISSLTRHDYKATLRLAEMNNRGIVPYVNYARTAENYTLTEDSDLSAQQIIKNTIDKINKNGNGTKISPEVQSYLLGESSSSLSLTDMNNQQINEFEMVLDRLPINAPNVGTNGTEEYGAYMNTYYK
ncbi:hypothetical protein [uncultured Streptococcus sp.]|nr:hypothetical protein [uncultured Streptococcus sp.]